MEQRIRVRAEAGKNLMMIMVFSTYPNNVELWKAIVNGVRGALPADGEVEKDRTIIKEDIKDQ